MRSLFKHPLEKGRTLTKKVVSKEVHFRRRFDFDIAENFGHAGEAHGFFIADVGETRDGIGKRGGNRRLEFDFFTARHGVGVFHTPGNQHPACTAQPHPLAVQIFVDRSSKSVDSLVQVDARLDRFVAQDGAFGHLNFFLLFRKFDRGHVREEGVKRGF